MNGKPSDFYEKRSECVWLNHQIPMRKDQKTNGKPSNLIEKRLETL